MAEKKLKTRGLGRGLSALMADVEADKLLQPSAQRRADVSLPIEKIQPNPNQPRRQFTVQQNADHYLSEDLGRDATQPNLGEFHFDPH